jgi:hypothetical protein
MQGEDGRMKPRRAVDPQELTQAPPGVKSAGMVDK